jgi:hypothetical protein
MDFTYTLIPGGYQLLADGIVFKNQPGSPFLPADPHTGELTPYSEAEAIEAAEADLAEIRVFEAQQVSE